jgi:hypothetical protein
VQPLRAGFREPIGERLRHDRVIVIVFLLEGGDQRIAPKAGR